MPDTQILALAGPAADQAIERAARVIRAGGLVAFPTETVYGLGANALSAEAVSGIYRAKRRSPDDPCIVHIGQPGDLEGVADLAGAAPGLAARAAALARAFWPGPLSLILPRGEAIPPIVTAGRDTVAVRMPAHPVALALIRAADVPIAAPSANTFMHTSPTTAQHVWDDLAGTIDLILDGGPTTLGVESTVLDLTRDVPAVLRPGGVSLEQLRAVIDVEVGMPPQPPHKDGGIGMPAPGLLEKHYAPRAEVILLEGPDIAVRRELIRRTEALLARGIRVGALLADEDANALAAALPGGPIVARLGPADDPDAIARRLFAAMRDLERQGAAVILARLVDAGGLGAAVRDRLRRAAGGRVISL